MPADDSHSATLRFHPHQQTPPGHTQFFFPILCLSRTKTFTELHSCTKNHTQRKAQKWHPALKKGRKIHHQTHNWSLHGAINTFTLQMYAVISRPHDQQEWLSAELSAVPSQVEHLATENLLTLLSGMAWGVSKEESWGRCTVTECNVKWWSNDCNSALAPGWVSQSESLKPKSINVMSMEECREWRFLGQRREGKEPRKNTKWPHSALHTEAESESPVKCASDVQ